MSDKQTSDSQRPISRRTVLGTIGASAATAGIAGVASAQSDGDGDGEGDDGPFPGYFPDGPTIGLEKVGEGLTAPTDFATADGSDHRYVADQTGQVYVHLGPEEGFQEEPFFDITEVITDPDERMVNVGGEVEGFFPDPLPAKYDERGLTGIQFHPDFAENGKFYVHFSSVPRDGTPEGYDHTEVVTEFHLNPESPTQAEIVDDRCTLLEIPHPQFNHNAGPMAFGPDGYLYIPMGDGGGFGDKYPGHVDDWYDENEGGNGQDVTDNLLGSIIRIDVDDEPGGAPYAIPEDNPLVGEEGLDELYAWGFRNPYRLSFDSEGRLFVGNVGQNLWEQVELVEKGSNHGWNVREGTTCFNAEDYDNPLGSCPSSTPEDVRGGEPLVDPVFQYPHMYPLYDGDPLGVGIIGGHVYEGDEIPELQGKYVFADYGGIAGEDVKPPAGRLFAAAPQDELGVSTPTQDEVFSQVAENADLWRGVELGVSGMDTPLPVFARAFGEGPDGELYLLTSRRGVPVGNTGAMWKLTSAE